MTKEQKDNLSTQLAYASLVIVVGATFTLALMPPAAPFLSVMGVLLSLKARSLNAPGTPLRSIANAALVLSIIIFIVLIGGFLGLYSTSLHSEVLK